MRSTSDKHGITTDTTTCTPTSAACGVCSAVLRREMIKKWPPIKPKSRVPWPSRTLDALVKQPWVVYVEFRQHNRRESRIPNFLSVSQSVIPPDCKHRSAPSRHEQHGHWVDHVTRRARARVCVCVWGGVELELRLKLEKWSQNDAAPGCCTWIGPAPSNRARARTTPRRTQSPCTTSCLKPQFGPIRTKSDQIGPNRTTPPTVRQSARHTEQVTSRPRDTTSRCRRWWTWEKQGGVKMMSKSL